MNVSHDILIYAKSQEAHDSILKEVSIRLQEKGLTLNYDKCLFNVKILTFFGYRFSKNGVKLEGKKIEAFVKLKPPSNISEVRSILGMINYCGRFIPKLGFYNQIVKRFVNEEQQVGLDRDRTNYH